MKTMEKHLEKLLDEKRRQSATDRSKLEARKADWLSRISKLYDQIEEWLQPLVEKKHIDPPSRQRYEIREQLLGTYPSEKLTIRFYNGKIIELLPQGLHIAGANGRIDMDMGGYLVTILGREDGSGWDFIEALGGRPIGGVAVRGRYLPSSRPGQELLPFTRENFEGLLAKFVEGF